MIPSPRLMETLVHAECVPCALLLTMSIALLAIAAGVLLWKARGRD